MLNAGRFKKEGVITESSKGVLRLAERAISIFSKEVSCDVKHNSVLNLVSTDDEYNCFVSSRYAGDIRGGGELEKSLRDLAYLLEERYSDKEIFQILLPSCDERSASDYVRIITLPSSMKSFYPGVLMNTKDGIPLALSNLNMTSNISNTEFARMFVGSIAGCDEKKVLSLLNSSKIYGYWYLTNDSLLSSVFENEGGDVLTVRW